MGSKNDVKKKPSYNKKHIDYIKSIRRGLLNIEDSAKNVNGLTDSQWVAIRAAHRLLGEYLEKQGEQNPAWSEEDEDALDIAIHIIQNGGDDCAGILDSNKVLDWLKSIKERMKGECISVTDEELAQAKKDAYNDALDKIEYHSGEPTFDDGWSAAIWYLKKKNAQPKNTWKPSDAQMQALEKVRVILHNPNIWDESNPILYQYEELMRDLIKLREE